MQTAVDEANLLVVSEEIEDSARRADPLTWWKPSSEPQDFMIRAFLRGHHVYAHTANRGGKGEGAGAAILSLCEGRKLIQGYHGPITVPQLKPPVVGVLCGESYKAMSISSTFTLRKLLGTPDPSRWREEHAGNPDYVSLFRIRHAQSRNQSEWSLLYVFPYDGALPEGGGLDFWWCDEPPPPRFLSTLGSRVAAGRHLRQIITATPQEKSKWYPISRDFAEVGANGHLTRWADRSLHGNRLRLKWSAAENEALGPRELRQLEDNAKGKPFARSILYGDEVDVHGGCPWPENLLMAAMEACRPPLRTERIRIEAAADGANVMADLQVWEDAKVGEPYYVVGDPAKGIRDGNHDPDGMHVRNRRSGALAARLVGYLGSWGLGHAMADMHARYNKAVCDPLVTGGYGEAMVQALRKRKVTNLTYDRFEERPGEWANRIGTTETEAMRQKMVSGVEREILSGALTCPSVEIIQSLMDCTVDENGKVVAMDKKHLPEDVACWGRYAVYSGQWDAPKVKAPPLKRYENPNVRILKAIQKRDEEIALKYGPKVGPTLARHINGNGAVEIEP